MTPTMKSKNIITLIAVIALAAAVAGIIWYKMSPDSDSTDIREATVSDVKSMVKLCSMDIYQETPIKAHIGRRHIFARVTLQGSVTFDIERLAIDSVGDTLRVELPPENVEIFESTEKNSYVVIDTWNDRTLGSTHFTAAEENKIKEQVKKNAIKNLYRKGFIRQARAEATGNLSRMLSAVTGKPVIVTDPTPEGKSRSSE